MALPQSKTCRPTTAASPASDLANAQHVAAAFIRQVRGVRRSRSPRIFRDLETPMAEKKKTHSLLLAGLVSLSGLCYAAPGEDTIQLQNPVEHLQLPIGGAPKSQGLDNASDGVPMHLRAKIARYEAQTFNDQADGIYTDNDVNRIVGAQANRKTCIQDVGSNTSASSGVRTGSGQQQIVVLRGDLVNICR